MSKKNVLIHYRVSNESKRDLLRNQRDKLVNKLTDKNSQIIGITNEISIVLIRL